MIFNILLSLFKNAPENKKKWRVFTIGFILYCVLYKCVFDNNFLRHIIWKIFMFDLIIVAIYLKIKILYFLKNHVV